MLRELYVRNFAVIESVQVQFHEGFHVLTGETGAGKSILIDALTVIIGGRGSHDLIRYGCEKAEVEAIFQMPVMHPVWHSLHELGIEVEPNDDLIIRRELSSQGKNICRINGRIVTMTNLREIGEYLINIHGQHEHQSLFKSERHLEWLDLYAGNRAEQLLLQYSKCYEAYQEAQRALKETELSLRQNGQMLDLYRFQLKEIEDAQLKPDEDEALQEERQKLMHSVKRRDASSEAYDLLYGRGGIDTLNKAISRLQEIEKYDSSIIKPIIEQMNSAFYQLEDAAYELRDYRDNVDSDPERLAYIETRLDLIHNLKRKYGESVNAILAYYEKTSHTVNSIVNNDDYVEQLRHNEKIYYEQAVQYALQLSAVRREAAAKLAKAIESELRQLLMERTTFQVDIISQSAAEPYKLTSQGIDEVVFMIAPNPGEPLKPLNKIASGGEMSRVMLALKAIFASIDRVPTLIFDEVDTGVSGRAAQAIAEKLSNLSAQCQVFSITHLPQVACMADHHYEIRKTMDAERTTTSVTELTRSSRIEELARMLGGVEVTQKTRTHAQEMVDLAVKKKKG